MSAVKRVNITDHVTLRRIARAGERIGDTNSTRTAYRLLNDKLNEMGIPLDPSDDREASVPGDGSEDVAAKDAGCIGPAASQR